MIITVKALSQNITIKNLAHLELAEVYLLKNEEGCIRSHRHCVKSVRIRSFSGTYFPAFGLNKETSPYSVRMRENTE